MVIPFLFRFLFGQCCNCSCFAVDFVGLHLIPFAGDIYNFTLAFCIESQDLHLNNNNSLLTSTAATTTLVTADSHENKGTITILMPPKTPLIFLDLSTQIYRCCELDEETKPDCFLNLNLDIAKCVWSWSIYL